uniref:Transposase n=1 Tax=Angiostrongylus cantonensis TaxID=6313 RepID=A0A0K0DQ07_ANGCA
MLGVSRFTQVRDEIRSSDLRQRSKIKDAVLYAKQSKIRWAGHVMRMNDNGWTRLLVTGFLGMSNVLQEDHPPDGQSSSRKA